MSPIRSLGGNRIRGLGHPGPLRLQIYTPVPWHWITTTESLRSLNAGLLVVTKAYSLCLAEKFHSGPRFSGYGVRLILHEYSQWPDILW
jgi:hypothetical protein